MNNSDKIKFLVNSFSVYFLEGTWEMLNYGTLKHLIRNCDCNLIQDSIISDNQDVYENINWGAMNRMKILRIISRNPGVIKFIDLNKYKFSIEEAKYLLVSRPDLFEVMGFDIERINQKEAYILLSTGVKEFYMRINIKKFVFTPKESYDILEASGFIEHVFNQLNTASFNDYYIADIIKNTGKKYIKRLDLKKLTPKKWNEIFFIFPIFIEFCDLKKYQESDIFYTAQLIFIFQSPELVYLIRERKNYKDEISALGWEKLIIGQPNEFIDECVFEKLNGGNWKRILYYHPELAVYKD